VPGNYQVMSPFAALSLAWQQKIHCHRYGGSMNLFPSLLCPPSLQHTDPLNWVDRSTLIIYYILVPRHLPTPDSKTNELKPPPMRNGGLPLAHLSSSMAALLNHQHWIKPPHCAPECAISNATPFSEAHFDTIICKMMITLHH
jgi:hypothetical protein